MAATKTDQRGIAQRCGVCGEAGHKRTRHFRGDTKQCTRCKQTLARTEFYPLYRRNDSGLMPSCKPCTNKLSRRTYTASPEARLRALWHSAKSRCAKSGTLFTVTIEDLYAKLSEQGGRCYYTGERMTFAGGPKATSLERRDPAAGYTAANLVLATWEVNDAKRALTEPQFIALCRAILKHRG